MYGRRSDEIIAWIRDGEIYCPDHGPAAGEDDSAEAGWGPIFLDSSATDSPNHCGVIDCETLIRSDLTTDGYRYVLETLGEHISNRALTDDSVLAQRWDEWGSEIGTAVESGNIDIRPGWLADMVAGYVECALWSETDDDGEPLDASYDRDDIDADALREMAAECVKFAADNVADLRGMDAGQAGHDFWLTRNRHGAGFFDRGLGERGDRLTASAHVYGESDLYVGDDGKLYVS